MKLLLRIRLLLLLYIFIMGTSSVSARVYIDITEPSFRQLPIAIPDFKRGETTHPELATTMAERLRKDLTLSGVFSCLDPSGFLENPQKMGTTVADISFPSWRRLGAEFLVRGQYYTRGDQLHLEMRFFDVVSGTMLVGQAYDGKVDDHPRMIHRFADEIMKYLTGVPGVFSTKIAFVNKEGEEQRLYMVDFDGSNPVLLTPQDNLVLSPHWSFDGMYIAYVGYKDISLMRLSLLIPSSGSIRTLYEGSGVIVAPRFHPSQPLLAVGLSLEGNPDIYLMNTSNGEVKKKLVGGWPIELPGSWSPDGRKLAYVSGETGFPQIYILDLETTHKMRLTFSGNYNTSPSWSTDGQWIAYSGKIDGYHQIFLIRPDGSEQIQLTSGNYNNEAPSWSPDGRMIAFHSSRSGKYSIWVMMKNGQNLRCLTNISGEQMLPAWSPRF